MHNEREKGWDEMKAVYKAATLSARIWKTESNSVPCTQRRDLRFIDSEAHPVRATRRRGCDSEACFRKTPWNTS